MSEQSLFRQTLDKLSEDEHNRDLDYAIQSWCKEIGDDYKFSDIKICIDEWQKESPFGYKIINHLSKGSFWFYNQIANTVDSNEENDKDYANTKRSVQKNKEGSAMTTQILIVAFILTGIGIFIFLLNQNRNKQKANKQSQNSLERKGQPVFPETPLPLSAQKKPVEKSILFLVLDADSAEDIIFSLKPGEKINNDAVRSLSSTSVLRALWQGRKSVFTQTKLEDRFSYSPRSSNKSEYDVYLVEIELDKPEDEFNEGINPMKRINAFKRLVKEDHKIIKVSERLPKEAYDTTVLYR